MSIRMDHRVVGREQVLKNDARCIDCGEPFTFNKNVFTEDGYKEIAISGTCERCFDSYFDGGDEN